MFSKNAPMANAAISVIKDVVFCAAIVLGTASAALAVGSTRGPAEIQKCVVNMQASARSFGSGDPDATGLAEYGVMVGRCMDDYYRLYRRLP